MDKAGAGYITLAKLREDATTAAIPFILMTGLADAAGMRHGMELGADDYLPKPFKVDELYAAVNARLRKVQTVREEAERKLTMLRSQISLMLPHEMRTPLNGIISNAELLATTRRRSAPPDIAEMGQEICQSGQRLERLIENFLIYAQLEIVATDAAERHRAALARTAPAGGNRPTHRHRAGGEGRPPARLMLELAGSPLPMAEEYFKKIVDRTGAERLQIFRSRVRRAGRA